MVVSRRDLGHASRHCGTVEPCNWRQAVNTFSTGKLQLPWASSKAGSAASLPVNLTFHMGPSYNGGWSLVIRLWALLWRRHIASNRVALTRLGPTRYNVWGLKKNLSSLFFSNSFDGSQKSPALLHPPHPSTIKGKHRKNAIIIIIGIGKWYSNDQTFKWDLMNTTLLHILLIHFTYHTAIYWDMDFNTLG